MTSDPELDVGAGELQPNELPAPEDSTPFNPTSNPLPDPSRGERFQSLIRLLVGSVDIGSEALMRRLQEWEALTTQKTGQVPGSGVVIHINGAEPVESESEKLRYILVGFLFEAQSEFSKSASRLGVIANQVERVIPRWVNPLFNSRYFAPLSKRYDALAERGEREVERWLQRGRSEAGRSRRLAEIALKETVDSNIRYLTNNPEVQELVETQSTGLANEVIEEVRERTVSADTFIENVLRRLLRITPRTTPPEPPAEVRKLAEGFHPPKKRYIDKA